MYGCVYINQKAFSSIFSKPFSEEKNQIFLSSSILTFISFTNVTVLHNNDFSQFRAVNLGLDIQRINRV